MQQPIWNIGIGFKTRYAGNCNYYIKLHISFHIIVHLEMPNQIGNQEWMYLIHLTSDPIIAGYLMCLFESLSGRYVKSYKFIVHTIYKQQHNYPNKWQISRNSVI